MRLITASIGIGFAAFAVSSVPVAAADDAKLIQGKWSVVKVEEDGMPYSQEKTDKAEVEFTKDRFRLLLGGGDVKYGYSLDATQNPKWINMKLREDKESTGFGIYELSGDDLKICLNTRKIGPPRPDKFESKPDSANIFLLVLKRKKP